MPVCSFKKRKHRKVCAGDLRTLLKLQDRDITPPDFDSVDFDENFVDASEVWALVETVTGKTVFDGVNADINVTHMIFIRFDATVTSETWVELEGKRLDIISTENLEGRDEWLLLVCTDRGVGEASKA